MKKDDLEAARSEVEAILEHFRTTDVYGLGEPASVLLVCYQVLAAFGDLRTLDVLGQGYRLVQGCAANIEDEPSRRSFLENVRANRELLAAWEAAQLKA